MQLYKRVLLPLEADEKIEALKHYYGITQQGELVVRGIEIRRHDIPNFIKQFQSELLYTLFDCKDSAEVAYKGYENALLLVTKAIDRIMTAVVEIDLPTDGIHLEVAPGACTLQSVPAQTSEESSEY